MMMSKIYVIKYDELDGTEYHTEIIGYVLTEEIAKRWCKSNSFYYEEVPPLEDL